MLNEGLIIQKSHNALDQATMEKQELKLLASADGIEIMTQIIEPNMTFDIYPLEEESTLMEFFYIIEGTIEYLPKNSKSVILTDNDYFYVKNLKEPTLFLTKSKVKLLYVSTQPIFHYLGESLKQLHRINHEVDAKDNYTHAHSERVRDLAVKTAINMNLDRDKIASLAIASLFHDVGKIYIDDTILKKPGKLTKDEFEVIKQHPIKSAEHVKDISYVDVANIVLQHHERIDGSGYPGGLKEDEICIEAKIIAVVDSFDAMTTQRPYQKTKTVEEAIIELKKLSGKLYDRDVINSFIKIVE